MKRWRPKRLAAAAKGFTLVELMIAMLLGLFLVAGAGGIFVANRQAYRSNNELARVQENARMAFELVAREVREAGGNPCGTSVVANVLTNPASTWWSDWAAGAIIGFDGNNDTAPVTFGTGVARRVNGTDAIILKSGSLQAGLMIVDHQSAAAQFKINKTNHGIEDGDVLMVCDNKTAAIFQATNTNQTNVTIVHQTGSTVTPGNCSKGLNYPTQCTTLGNQKTFEDGGFLVELTAAFWYIGNNPRGGRSLYRLGMSGDPDDLAAGAVEIAEGVRDMQIQYLLRTVATGALAVSYAHAAAITNWSLAAANRVVAVRFQLDLESGEAVGTDNATLKRRLFYVVSLRERELMP